MNKLTCMETRGLHLTSLIEICVIILVSLYLCKNFLVRGRVRSLVARIVRMNTNEGHFTHWKKRTRFF